MSDFVMPESQFSESEIAVVYDELSFWSSRFGALLFRHLKLRRNSSILDLGCGTGFPLLELAHVFGTSSRVTGVDIWHDALLRARTRQAVYGLTNVSVVEADGAGLPFAAEQFDLIVSNLGVNNFADTQAAFSECFRVLKHGGKLVLTTNITGHMQEFYDVFRATLLDGGYRRYLPRLTANEAHRGTTVSLSALLEAAGFRVTAEIEDSFQMHYMDGTTLLNHSLTRIGFLGGWRAVVEPEDEIAVFAEDEIAVFAEVERRLNDIARRDGELLMSVPMLYLEGEKV